MEASFLPNDEMTDLRPVPLHPDDAAAPPAEVPTTSTLPSLGSAMEGMSPLGGGGIDTADQSDLVAQVVGDSGLLPSDKLDAVRARAAGGSFSRALLEE